MQKKIGITHAAIGAALALGINGAVWAAVPAGWECSNDQMTFAVDGATPVDATDCQGWDDAVGASPGDEATFVNDGWEDVFGDGAFTYVRKFNDGGGEEGPGTFGGLSFTLSTTPGASGTFSLTWDDGGGGILPETLDIAFVAKSGGGSGAFLFDDVVLTADPMTGGGTFEIGVLNSKGEPRAISHLTMLLREGDDSGGGSGVPAPMPLSLAALGLLVMLRRKR